MTRQAVTPFGDLARLSAQQWALRAVSPSSTLAFLAFAAAAGGRLHPVAAATALVIALGVALMPDSDAGLLVLFYLAGYWLLTVPEGVSGWLLLAGLAVLALHACTTMAAYGPPGVVLERPMLRRWVTRVLAAAGVTGGVWACVWAAAQVRLPAGGWLLGVALMVCLAAAALVLHGTAPKGSRDP